MTNKCSAGYGVDYISPIDAGAREPVPEYRQISYEEIEECVLAVRDSISEFYLAPQGEISFAAAEAAAYMHKAANLAEWAGADQDAGGRDVNGREVYCHATDERETREIADFPQKAHIDGAPGEEPPGEGPAAETAYGGIDSATGAGGGDVPLEAADYAEGHAAAAAQAKTASEFAAAGGGGAFQPYNIQMRRVYRENINKRVKRHRSSALKYVGVCFGGAVLGGALVVLCFTLFFPVFSKLIYPQGSGGEYEIVHQYEFEKLSSPAEAVYRKVSPCIVRIRATTSFNSFFYGRQQITGEGSGIIIQKDGYILTSNHVIFPAPPPYVPFQSDEDADFRIGGPIIIEVTLADKPDEVYAAIFVASDAKTDIAVLKIDAANLPVAELGDSDLLKPGEMVIALGSPGGQDSAGTVTDGIVSGFSSFVNANSEREINMIRTSAAINASNCGGALANADGQVVGINVVRTDAAGLEGIGFAIPINSARAVASNLIDYNFVRGRAKTGLKYAESYDENYEYYKSRYPDLPKGAWVEYVEPLSGAFTAGITAGDVVTKMKGRTINDSAEALALKEELVPGEIIEVEVYRAGEYIVMNLEVSEETGD